MNFYLSAFGFCELDALITAAEKRRSAPFLRRAMHVVCAELIAFAANSGYKINELVGSRADPTESRNGQRRTGGKGVGCNLLSGVVGVALIEEDVEEVLWPPQKVPHDLEVLSVLISNKSWTFHLHLIDQGIRVRHDYWRVRCNDEL